MEQVRYKVQEFSIANCTLAPYCPDITLGEQLGDWISEDHLAQRDVLADRMTPYEPLLSPVYGIVVQEEVQIIRGGYQIEAFKVAFPGKSLPVRIAESGNFTQSEIVSILLSELGGMEDNPGVQSQTILSLKKHLGLIDRELAAASGWSRNKVNTVKRLSSLDKTVLNNLRLGIISYSVARELISVPVEDQEALMMDVIRKGWDITTLRKKLGRSASTQSQGKAVVASKDDIAIVGTGNPTAEASQQTKTDLARYETYYSEAIGYPVKMNMEGGTGGVFVISPFDRTGLEVIVDKLNSYAAGKTSIHIPFQDLDELEEITAGLAPGEEDF